MQNRWLSTTRQLAREVAVERYIYAADTTRSGWGDRPRANFATRALMALALLIFGAGLGQLGAMAAGYRLVGATQLRLIEAVYRVDPQPERLTDADLTRRLEFRAEAIDLIERSVAMGRSADQYPYLSILANHPSPKTDPGEGSALLLLARAIDAYPRAVRGKLIERIVALGVALGDNDLQVALSTLSDLAPEKRLRLIADGAALLKRLVDHVLAIDDATSGRDSLQAKLTAERASLAFEKEALESAVRNVRQQARDLSMLDRRCTTMFEQARACLIAAGQNHPLP